MIERVNRGLYRVPEALSGMDLDFEELVLTAVGIPYGVICLISALCYYHLTDQIMREYWIAIPNTERSPKRPHAKIVRMRNMTLGQTTIQIGNYKVKIFDRERTVVDQQFPPERKFNRMSRIGRILKIELMSLLAKNEEIFLYPAYPAHPVFFLFPVLASV